jgi:hypothetical protein
MDTQKKITRKSKKGGLLNLTYKTESVITVSLFVFYAVRTSALKKELHSPSFSNIISGIVGFWPETSHLTLSDGFLF